MKRRIDSLIATKCRMDAARLAPTGATLLQRLGLNQEVIDGRQNHKPGGVASIYQQYQFRAERFVVSLGARSQWNVTGLRQRCADH